MARLEYIKLSLQIAGCPNTCRHCKDGGRPPFGALMGLADTRWVLEQFRSVADMLLPCVYFEPTAHPEMVALWELSREFSNDPEMDWSVFSTNGYGIANADDPEAVLQRLHATGVRRLVLTLHGERQHHDWFVRRSGAFDDIWQTARLCAPCGLSTHSNFYVDRRNVADFEPFLDRVAALGGATDGQAETYLGLPDFLPSPRLRTYEQTLRPRPADLEPIRHHVCERWGGDLEDYTEGSWVSRLLDPADSLALPEQPRDQAKGAAFIVDAAFDIYEMPWPYAWSMMRHGRVRHGNLRADGLDAIIERHLAWERPHYPTATELAQRYGDRNSDLMHRNPMSLRAKWIDRWLAEHGSAGTAHASASP